MTDVQVCDHCGATDTLLREQWSFMQQPTGKLECRDSIPCIRRRSDADLAADKARRANREAHR